MKTQDNIGQEIIVENAPIIPGLKFRSFRGEEDYSRMLEVLNSVKEVDKIEHSTNLEEIKRSYSHLVRCNPFTDMLFAEIKGEVVAYGRCDWDEELNTDRLYNFSLFVNPEWRDDELGNAMIDYFMNHLDQIAADHPLENPKFYQVWATDNKMWLRNLIELKGFTPERYMFMMKRPCSKPVKVFSLPEGIEIRAIGKEDIRKVWEADQEAFKDHWGYVAGTEKNYQGWLKSLSFNPDLWKVAWDGDDIAGMVLNFVDENENEEFKRLRGYTEDISVRRPWRRQGIARALLTQSVKMFQEMGLEETVLYVDTENPLGALNLYQDVGYKEDKRSIVYRKKLG